MDKENRRNSGEHRKINLALVGGIVLILASAASFETGAARSHSGLNHAPGEIIQPRSTLDTRLMLGGLGGITTGFLLYMGGLYADSRGKSKK